MSEPLPDQGARDRFRDEWRGNFAVSANAGSGKTTAISERLAAMALDAEGAPLLAKTAVVTFTKKAAAQIGRRARAVLVARLAEAGRPDLAPLDQLERAFFGTIHSFCLLLAQRYGQTLGLNLNPEVVEDDDEALWEEFLEQDAMEFTALSRGQTDAFLRHVPLDAVFEMARQMGRAEARRLVAPELAALPPEPSAGALAAIRAATTKGRGAEGLSFNQQQAAEWLRRWREETSFLPLPKPMGTAAGIRDLYAALLAPVKSWLAQAGAALAAELALRYRAWRFERGVQTYADQVEAALTVLRDPATLRRIRQEGWRVILDEAQDTDPQQFAVLVEIAREVDAPLRTWPAQPGDGPRPGHFCLVGDGQQSIYGSRADIKNFQQHLEAFRRGDGGELLTFDVTFRSPHRIVALLNETLPAAFGAGREHNCGLAVTEGAAPLLLQVPYEPLVAGPGAEEGAVVVLPLEPVPEKKPGVDLLQAAEARQVAQWLGRNGPAGVGAAAWGDICVLAPRNDWLLTIRKEFEAAGLKTSLQMRKNRNGDNPAFAWLTGLVAAVCDPDNHFEWTGVLREVFAVSDAVIAAELKREKRFAWETPEVAAEPLRGALALLGSFVARVDGEGESLARFASDLVKATHLAEKAAMIDPGGGLGAELERLLARAAEAGREGAGPRDWLGLLREEIDDGRPAGKPQADAINLLTAHSAKGLEWPVVIAMGLGRKIGTMPETGLRLIPAPEGVVQVYFDGDSLPEQTKESRERERVRELVRLLYVTLTRARRTLVLPWGAEFAGPAPVAGSFLDLWGWRPVASPAAEGYRPAVEAEPRIVTAVEEVPEEAVPLELAQVVGHPKRVLPHQLARLPDVVRRSRHEQGADEPAVVREESGDPIEYGTWWHETMEFLPWRGDEAAVAAHLAGRIEVARGRGFGERAERELGQLLAAEIWSRLRSDDGEILTEVGVVVRMADGGWVDGVIDLVVRNAATAEVLIVDWKTNRIAAGEGANGLVERLRREYEPQLEAYRECVRVFFPDEAIKVGVFSTAGGLWNGW